MILPIFDNKHWERYARHGGRVVCVFGLRLGSQARPFFTFGAPKAPPSMTASRRSIGRRAHVAVVLRLFPRPTPSPVHTPNGHYSSPPSGLGNWNLSRLPAVAPSRQLFPRKVPKIGRLLGWNPSSIPMEGIRPRGKTSPSLLRFPLARLWRPSPCCMRRM